MPILEPVPAANHTDGKLALGKRHEKHKPTKREKRTTAEVWGKWQSEIMASIKKEGFTDFYNKSKMVTSSLITAHSPINPSFQNAMWNFDLGNTLK